MKKKINQAGIKNRRLSERQKALFISWVCFLLIGALLGYGICALAGEGQAPIEENIEAEQTSETLPSCNISEEESSTDETSAEWAFKCDDEFAALDCALSKELQEFTYCLCKGYYIDFSFAMALMFRESGFDIKAVGADGRDHGLFQIRDVNSQWLKEAIGITDLEDPYQNIHAGLFILQGLFEKYGDPALVLMAYNMGEYGASLLWEQGIYETAFTQKVFETVSEYEIELESKK